MQEQKIWHAGVLGMTLNVDEGRITIFRSTLETLGWPSHYRFLYNPQMNQIAVQVCSAADAGAHRVGKLNEFSSCEIKCVAFVRMVYEPHVLEILHERERKALICFSALERQEEKLSAEKAEIVKQRVALYEQYADGNMSKEEFIRQRDAYRVQEDEKMEQIQRLRTEKNQAFQPVKRDTDHLQTVMSTVEEAGDVMYLSQNVVETFIDRIEVFNDEHVKIHFTFENVLADYAE